MRQKVKLVDCRTLNHDKHKNWSNLLLELLWIKVRLFSFFVLNESASGGIPYPLQTYNIILSTAEEWRKYCHYGNKHQSINQSTAVRGSSLYSLQKILQLSPTWKTICFGINLINGETPYIVFSECRDTLHGETYIGLTSHTVTGKQCLRWDSVNSSNPDYAAIRNLKGSISDHENYCRNPDRKTSPWCFIQRDSDQWEYCDIPFCKRGLYIFVDLAYVVKLV